MDDFCIAVKDGAMFVSVFANGYNVVEMMFRSSSTFFDR